MISTSRMVGPRPGRTLAPIALSVSLLAGCTTAPAPVEAPAPIAREAVPAAGTQVNPQLAIPVASGGYRCELNARVDIKTDSRDANRIDVGWKGQRYSLVRHDSYSGLPRFEDKSSQLVWVVLPWKGLLLDGRSGQPLANECKLG